MTKPLLAESVLSSEAKPKLFTVGTLTYTRKGLARLFVWLMLNDFCLILFEQVRNLGVVLYKNNGATFATMGLLASITSLSLIWVNPFFSTWSDRHRGGLGRRRPFLLFAAPPAAFFLGALPFMPALGRFLEHFHYAKACFHDIGISGPVLLIGICGLFASFFNCVLLAIFMYYYWDVVPEMVLGRFNSLTRIVALSATFIWLYWVFGLADHHFTAVYVGVAIFFFVVFMVSAWRVKEGRYPPPQLREKSGAWEAIRTYFTDCYTHPRYLWVFAAGALFALQLFGTNIQFVYLHYDLHLDLDTIGKYQAIPQLFMIPFGYLVGSLIDRVKPVRIIPVTVILLGYANLYGYLFVHDKWTLFTYAVLYNALSFAYGVALSAFPVEVYPREKLGQFCSAAVFFYQVPFFVLGEPVGRMWDMLHNNRLGYLWSAVMMFFSSLAYYKIYWNWLRNQKDQAPPGEDVPKS